MLLCLRCRPAAAGHIRPLAREPPHAASVALKRKKEREREREREGGKEEGKRICIYYVPALDIRGPECVLLD